MFPLSPPNSQPGSPSPFFSATANGTAFVLPDVIANAAAVPPNNARAAPPSAAFAPTVSARAPNATASHAMPGASPLVLDAASVREKLMRKRKRVKVTKRKKLATACEAYEAQRKVARTSAVACACATRYNQEMDVVMVDDDDDESMAEPQERIAPEYLLRNCYNATSAAAFASHDFEHVPTVHKSSCCLHQRQPSTSSTHPSHSLPVCMHVGEELRKIVECFRNPKEVSFFI